MTTRNLIRTIYWVIIIFILIMAFRVLAFGFRFISSDLGQKETQSPNRNVLLEVEKYMGTEFPHGTEVDVIKTSRWNYISWMAKLRIPQEHYGEFLSLAEFDTVVEDADEFRRGRMRSFEKEQWVAAEEVRDQTCYFKQFTWADTIANETIQGLAELCGQRVDSEYVVFFDAVVW